MAFQTESFVKKMILELQQQCAGRGSELSKTLVALMVKSVLSDSKNNLNADQGLTEEERHRLEELCLNKLTEKCNPAIHTIKMQEYFAATYTSKCQFLEQIRGAVELRMSPLRREITDSRLETRDAFDALHSKISFLRPSMVQRGLTCRGQQREPSQSCPAKCFPSH
ncbi:hypothetical protein fugu_017366 [Takifugu bimaculatus]|uniref:Cilia- and flagella-associated protein 206 n=1 Tax=Takifugu bimaculatus TaxID=433685 RepID=A0A4Z2BS20_9TELE|nr:hypothetical protein fugu_017366 [Takifugu bimaculatus]